MGLIIFLAVSYGLWSVYGALPDYNHMPSLFFWVIVATGMIGMIYHKKRLNSLYYVAVIIMGATWGFVQMSIGALKSFAENIASNPYSFFSADFVVRVGVYSPLIIGFIVFLFSARTIVLLERTNPDKKEIKEYSPSLSPKKAIKSVKKKFEKIKSTSQNIRNIWALENLSEVIENNGEESKPIRLPVRKRLKGIFKMFFIKPKKFEDEFELKICIDTESHRKIGIKYLDVFLHFLIMGPTGSGKTFGVIKPLAWQIIKYIVKIKKIGLTVVEPKGDLAEDIASWCKRHDISHVYINPLDENSAKFNPLQGDPQIVAESTRTVLKKLFGKQDAFFSQIQETAARNTILLLKRLHGDKLNLHDVVRVLRDQDKMREKVQLLERKTDPNDDLVQYFQKEVLGSLKGEYQKFAMGLRMQLEDLMGNDMLKQVITGESDINFDKHLEEGGILVVNTAMGPLGKLGDAFGTFLIMHLQNAVFRRPGNEYTRTPHVLIIDEAPRYINPDFERLLTIGRSFRCACVLALQSLGQLEVEERRGFTNIVMSNCRNKVVFGGLDEEDARKFEKEFGDEEVNIVQGTYDNTLLKPQVLPERYRTTRNREPRFLYTHIIELPQYHFIYRLYIDGKLQLPAVGIGDPVDLDELKQEENKGTTVQDTSCITVGESKGLPYSDEQEIARGKPPKPPSAQAAKKREVDSTSKAIMKFKFIPPDQESICKTDQNENHQQLNMTTNEDIANTVRRQSDATKDEQLESKNSEREKSNASHKKPEEKFEFNDNDPWGVIDEL